MNDLNTAKSAQSKAEDAVGSALLDVRTAGLVPTVEKMTPDGRTYRTEVPAWDDFYYHRTIKNAERFERELPAAAQPMQAKIVALKEAILAKKQALAVEKARKEAARAQRASVQAERQANPHRPLASVNPVAAENYDALCAIFGSQRATYVAAVTESALRAACGRVVANVRVPEVQAAAEANFNAYLGKLATKITARIQSGSLSGYLWNGSTLTVETEAGRQVWSTKCIINCSCLGKLFNQWPTRRVS